MSTDRELLIRIDERLKNVGEKLDTHIIESKERVDEFKNDLKDVQKDIKNINKWRYGVIGSWLIAMGSYFKGG